MPLHSRTKTKEYKKDLTRPLVFRPILLNDRYFFVIQRAMKVSIMVDINQNI